MHPHRDTRHSDVSGDAGALVVGACFDNPDAVSIVVFHKAENSVFSFVEFPGCPIKPDAEFILIAD